MHYEEIYNASEGFFAIQDEPNEKGMLLMLDYGVFYEFIPLDALPDDEDALIDPQLPIPLWEVEQGITYAMLITTLGGLHRYLIGDTVEFTSLSPYRIVISGRTKHYINAFGEELMVANAEKALAQACSKTCAKVRDYTAAPHFFREEGKGRHDWLIEFEEEPQDIEDFANELDQALKTLNSDYEAKRYEDMTLRRLSVTSAPQELFNMWLEAKGKLGGQNKIPRLCNTRKYIDELLLLQVSERPSV